MSGVSPQCQSSCLYVLLLNKFNDEVITFPCAKLPAILTKFRAGKSQALQDTQPLSSIKHFDFSGLEGSLKCGQVAYITPWATESNVD